MVVKDIGVCSALVTAGLNPTRTVIIDKKIAWEFDDETRARELREQYFSGSLQGPLLAYNENLRAFQALLKAKGAFFAVGVPNGSR
jgi:hypothetical protein